MSKIDDLYRRAQQHLADLKSGKVARERREAMTFAKFQKQKVKEARAERRTVKARIKEVQTELNEAEELQDEMLEFGEEWPGAIQCAEEAIQGCQNELTQLTQQLAQLEDMIGTTK